MITYIREQNRKHTIVSSIILTIITLIIGSLFVWDNNPITGLDKLTNDILISIFCIFVIYLLCLNKTAGFQKEGFWKGMLYGIPFLVIGIGACMISNIGTNIFELKPISFVGVLLFTINMLFVGINEELSMRSLVLNNLMLKYGKDRKGVYKALIIAAMIFGAIHLVNIFFVPPITVIVQAINAASAGVLFGAIFICSKNVWACIMIHAMVDWISLFVGQCFIGGESVLSIEMTVLQGIVMVILGAVPPIIIAVLLMRKKYKS
ncbi:MAG: CPBP family intramembrane metalloprotease [Clostridia bacterium]|nr:CPBP family intramembrane metalloprotease [Clostridia bacterium]